MDEIEKQRRDLEAIAAKLQEGHRLLDAALKSAQDGQARGTDLHDQEEARKVCQEMSSRVEDWKKELQYINEATQELQEAAESNGAWSRIRWEAQQIQKDIFVRALLLVSSRTTFPAQLPEHIKRIVTMNVKEELAKTLENAKMLEKNIAFLEERVGRRDKTIETLETYAEDAQSQHERAIGSLKIQHQRAVVDLESRHETEIEDLNVQLRHAENRTVAAKADRESIISLYNAEQTISQEKGQIINSLKENINSFKKNIATQKATIKDRDVTIGTKEKYIKSLKATIKDGDSTISTKDKQINSFKENIASQKATIKDRDVTISTKDKHIQTLKSTIDSKKDVIRARNAEIQEKVGLIDSLEEKVQSSQGAVNAHRKTISFLHGRIASSKRVIKVKGRTIESLRKTIKSRTLLLNARKKKIRSLGARLSSVKASRAATMTSLGDLQDRYDAKEDDLAILQGYNTNLLRNINRLAEREENLGQVWVSANGLLQAMENLCQIRTETIKSLRGQVESNQTLMANKDRTIASLETEKTTANNTINALNRANAAKTETITSLSANVASRDRDKKRLEQEIKALESSHANAVEQLKSEQAQAMQKLSGKAEQDLLGKAQEVEGLKSELSRKEAELSGNQTELSGKQAELFRNQAKLSQKQTELSQKQADLFRKEAELQSSKQSLDQADETVKSLRQEVTDLTANARKGADLARVNSDRIQNLEAQKTTLTEGLAVSFATEFKSSADVASWVPFVNRLAEHNYGSAQPWAGEEPWVILPPWTSDDPVGEKPAPSSVTSLCGQLFSSLLESEFNNCHIHLLGMLTKSLAKEASPPVNLVILVLEKCLAESEQRNVTQHTFDHFYLIPLWQVATVLSQRWPDHPTQSLCDKVRDLVSSCYCAPVYDAMKNGCDAMASQLVALEEPSRQSMFLPTLGMGFMGFGGQLREGILVVCPRDRSLRLVTSSQSVWEGDVYRMRAPQGEQDILLEPKTGAEYFWIFANTDQKYV